MKSTTYEDLTVSFPTVRFLYSSGQSAPKRPVMHSCELNALSLTQENATGPHSAGRAPEHPRLQSGERMSIVTESRVSIIA